MIETIEKSWMDLVKVIGPLIYKEVPEILEKSEKEEEIINLMMETSRLCFLGGTKIVSENISNLLRTDAQIEIEHIRALVDSLSKSAEHGLT